MIYVIGAAVIFILDYFIKKNVEEKRKTGEEQELLDGRVILTKYHNKGAALNFLAKRPKILTLIHTGLWGFLSGVFAVLLRKKENPGLLAGLALMLGGGASNLFDRIKRGHVIDYVSFGVKWKKFRNIVFNVSDFFVFLGAALTVIFGRRK